MSADIGYLKVWDVFNDRLEEVDSTLENRKGPSDVMLLMILLVLVNNQSK